MNRSANGLSGAGEWSNCRSFCLISKESEFSTSDADMAGIACMPLKTAPLLSWELTFQRKCCQLQKRKRTSKDYMQKAAMEILTDLPDNSYDIILSSLAFHYIKDFEHLVHKISSWTSPGGRFIFSVEHPVFTAYGSQDWYYDASGNILHFPVDNYYYEGRRNAVFLGEPVIKYHRTLTTYLNTLLLNDFVLEHIIEPEPPEDMMDLPGMKDEMRRPMMLLVSAVKQ